VLATVATLLVVLVYALAVRTALGQRLDASALNGRHVLSSHDLNVASRLHTSIDVASIALLGSAIMLVALFRGRIRLAFGAGVIIVGSVATSEVLKRALPRPDLGVTDALGHTPSFPSGHTSVAMALAVGAVFVAPRRARAPVALLGAVFASGMGASLVATASHRPSDTIGAALVVTAWSAAVASVLLRSDSVRSGSVQANGRPTLLSFSPWMALGGIVLLVGSFAAAAITIIAIHYGRLDTVRFGREFVAASGAIAGTVLVCMAALLIALQSSDLDP
jgi:membrane-associated phospholipid phosphatase